jgi:dTDP-4-dehydrorhamnose reductase
VTGAAGQVGLSLTQSALPGFEIHPASRAELDVCDEALVCRYVENHGPDLVINAAAYTAVDRAETDIEQAIRANVIGPRNLALAVKSLSSSRMIHISTDFVFDGRRNTPYCPQDATGPLSVYGRTKLEGEQEVQRILGHRALLVRTGWVYSATGSNFLLTMLRLLRRDAAVRVVEDQVGTPTAAHSLARALWAFAARPDLSGIFHWSDAGVASWYDFSVGIAEEAAAAGLLPKTFSVAPIRSIEYPTAAARPTYSVLDKHTSVEALGIAPTHWRTNLRSVIKELQLA